MIRLEVKVEIPDNRKKEDFLKLLLHSGQDNDVFLWQNSFDIKEMERATFEAVLGEGAFLSLRVVNFFVLLVILQIRNKQW